MLNIKSGGNTMEIKLKNGQKVKAYPLIPAQSLMLYVSRHHSKDAPVLNIVTGYYWQGDFDTETMKEALYEAMDRCDTMRLRFTKRPFNKVYQYLADKHEIEIIEEDLSSMSWDDAHEFLKQRSHSIIDMYEKPVNEIRIIHLENGYNGICMKLHHLAFDGYSSKAFLADALSIYFHKRYGTAYPKPMRSYIEMVEKELKYPKSEQHKKDVAFWKGTIKNEPEPIYTDYVRPSRLIRQRIEKKKPDLRKAEVLDNNPASRTLRFSLDAETSEKLMKMCSERSLSLPCVLMMGMRSALSSFNNDEKDISYKVMVNRRATLLDKKSGGVRMHFFSMRNIVEPEMTFEEAVRVIEKAQNDIFEHSNMGSMEAVMLRHLAMKCGPRYTYECITFSYHPHFPMPYYGEEMKKSSRGFWYNNDASVQPLYLTVMHRSYDNGLDFNFEYRIANNPVDELHHFYDKMLDTFLLGIENPDIKVSEILAKIKKDKVK